MVLLKILKNDPKNLYNDFFNDAQNHDAAAHPNDFAQYSI